MKDESGDFLVIGVDLGSEHTITSLLIVEDMGKGNSWTLSENQRASNLENVYVIIGQEQIAPEFGGQKDDSTNDSGIVRPKPAGQQSIIDFIDNSERCLGSPFMTRRTPKYYYNPLSYSYDAEAKIYDKRN